jgi:hypothetical protein
MRRPAARNSILTGKALNKVNVCRRRADGLRESPEIPRLAA